MFEPFRSPFMARALVEVVIVGLVCGVLSGHVLLRRLAFFTEAVTHTVFPGAAAALLLGASIELGAAVTGIVAALVLAALATHRAVDSDAGVAVVLTTFVGIGVMLISRSRGFSNDLSALLFGQLVGVSIADIITTAVLGAISLCIVLAVHKELVQRAFDPEGAAAAGQPVARLDLALDLAITLAVVGSIRAVGTGLAVAMLVLPGVIARLLTSTVRALLLGGAVAGLVAGYVGLITSYELSVRHGLPTPAGATVVLTLLMLAGVVGLATRTRWIAAPS